MKKLLLAAGIEPSSCCSVVGFYTSILGTLSSFFNKIYSGLFFIPNLCPCVLELLGWDVGSQVVSILTLNFGTDGCNAIAKWVIASLVITCLVHVNQRKSSECAHRVDTSYTRLDHFSMLKFVFSRRPRRRDWTVFGWTLQPGNQHVVSLNLIADSKTGLNIFKERFLHILHELGKLKKTSLQWKLKPCRVNL